MHLVDYLSFNSMMCLKGGKCMDLGKKILKIRKDSKMSQDEFAETLHVTRQTVSNWENSKNYPDIETLIRISDTFHISLDVLLKGDKKMVNKIDKQINSSKRFKMLAFLFIGLLVIVSIFIVKNMYMKRESERKDNIRYEQIIHNINRLGFQKDEIGFASIVEDEVTYKIYIKRPQVLENYMSATSFIRDEMISVTYDGKNIIVTYLNENDTAVYCNKYGALENRNQNKNNIIIYNRYKDRTVQIVTRVVELFNGIYK